MRIEAILPPIQIKPKACARSWRAQLHPPIEIPAMEVEIPERYVRFTRWVLSVVAHLHGLREIYRRLEDSQQQKRCLRSLDNLGKVLRRGGLPDRVARQLEDAALAAAKAAAATVPDGEEQGAEGSWWGLVLATSTRLLVLFNGQLHLRNVEQAALDGIICAFPEAEAQALIRVCMERPETPEEGKKGAAA